MLNAILSIAGSSHQGHERFRLISFMSFSALLCDWDTATVDQILIEGDRMYLNARESQSYPDTDTLSLVYLPNQARSTVQSPAIEVTAQNQSLVQVTKSPSEANNSLYCYSCVLKMSLLFMNLHNIIL